MRYFVFICVLVLIPCTVHAAVHITEVAWMGTSESQYSEWLEFYNDGGSLVNLAGWKLYEGDGGALVFTFTKSISANGYLLLERTTASAPDAVPGIDDESGPFGGGGLANTGEDLVLKNSSGSLVEELNYSTGWPAGDATTKKTMQWNGSKWITATPTPKQGVSGGGDGDTSDGEVVVDTEDVDPFPIPKVSSNKPNIAFSIPPVVYTGVQYQFEANPIFEFNYHVQEGDIYWNMGDGTTISQHDVAPIMHTYTYPGTYTMSYTYTDIEHRNTPLKGTKKVQVITPTISISILNKTALQIKNTSTTPVDLTGWKVVIPGRSLGIPDATIISEKATVVIPMIALGVPSATSATIVDPSGSIVARSDEVAVVSKSNVVNAIEYDPIDTVASQTSDFTAETSSGDSDTPIRNRTKTYIFGAVALFVIGLSILLERFMAQQEYEEGEL